ncbi:beta-galactosidase 15-like [Aristolochia californica]|uniref:beta-galactosidase 15-like n=1 Tax=Aristolochia californica TaxID=171875 RepID=UPI0035E11453
MGSFVLKLAVLALLSCASLATDVSYDGRAIKINGERRVLLSGSIHYPRSTPELWPDLIQKAREGGLDAIETYVFWNAHEPRRREYDFEDRLDLVRFIKTVQEAGLYAVLRIGPYVCAEWNYGGFPVWLHQMPGMVIRTDNEMFKNEMQNFTTLIVDMMKQEQLFASQGGPIILAQIENEYGNVQKYYGEAGKKYLQWCATMAESFDIGIPWIMCQQADAPVPMINTCNGWYCDNFTPTNPNTPKMWTENWTGWFKAWGENDPHRRAEDVAFAVARFFQTGGVFQNYYMYHGGTNFGRTAGGPYISTTYDYDAPLDEYGHLNQPKWGHLKQLHAVIKSMERVLTHGDNVTTDMGNGVASTVYTEEGSCVAFLSNVNTTTDATITFNGNQYLVPAWSVSILPDCSEEVYNTAKVSTQTSVKVKQPNMAEDQPEQLKWVWRPERLAEVLKGWAGRDSFTASRLIDQITVTGDASDYLWYMTPVRIEKSDPIFNNEVTLRVNSSGHVLHAFFNGKFVGSQYGPAYGKYDFVFEAPIHITQETNYLALLSATVGLANYNAAFDMFLTGIAGGPVQLIADGKVVKDLSNNNWTYKVGLDGEDEKLHSDESDHKWHSKNLPVNRKMSWYRTTFKAPLGLEPVVVNLQTMGKGEAWVNGRSIGRFWSNFSSALEGCGECDYRGSYNPDKCAIECGQPTQTWYHVPRSFLKTDDNILTLFEEFGGNPTGVSFQTVTVGTACGSVPEGGLLELSCSGGRSISKIEFASFGDVTGSCGSYVKGACESEEAMAPVQESCLGKTSCSIEASEANLGASNCGLGVNKRLVVHAVC